jgi:hypothetical protein
MIRTFDTKEEQRAGLEGVARNIETFWRELAESSHGGMDLSVAVKSDVQTLRLIAEKLA